MTPSSEAIPGTEIAKPAPIEVTAGDAGLGAAFLATQAGIEQQLKDAMLLSLKDALAMVWVKLQQEKWEWDGVWLHYNMAGDILEAIKNKDFSNAHVPKIQEKQLKPVIPTKGQTTP